MRHSWLAALLVASVARPAQAAAPITYTFHALAEHGTTIGSAPTLFHVGAVFRVTVIVDAGAVGTDDSYGKLYQGGVACSSTNANPPIIAVYVNGDTSRNYGGGSCTTIEVTNSGVTMSSALLGIGLTFSARFAAAASQTDYALPKRILTATQFTTSTYEIIQPYGSAVSGDWTSR